MRARRGFEGIVLWRPRTGRLLGGVCAGLAERLGIHVWLLRVAFVTLALADGLGVVLYALGWVLLPNEGEPMAGASLRRNAGHRLGVFRNELGALADDVREGWMRSGSSPWPRPLSRRWIGIVLVFAGGFVLLASFGLFAWVTPIRALGLAALAVGTGILMAVYGSDR